MSFDQVHHQVLLLLLLRYILYTETEYLKMFSDGFFLFLALPSTSITQSCSSVIMLILFSGSRGLLLITMIVVLLLLVK